MRRAALVATVLWGLASCRAESHRAPPTPIEPPVSSPSSIPDAPVNGVLRGAQFVLRDARYLVDRRVGYLHTDILLSAGTAESPCGPIAPPHAPSVWLRLEGEAISGPQELHFSPGQSGPWSVHYQFFEDDHWVGVGEAGALVTIRAPSADGRILGGLAICFSDDRKSCVSGSFDAQSCPSSLDQPVRGSAPLETVPAEYRLVMLDAGVRRDADAER